MTEVEEYMKITYKDKWETAIDSLIKFSRHLQRDFMEGDGELSGEQFLKEMVDKGSFPLSSFFAILPAVTHYDKPYELNVSERNKEEIDE
tara:strand:- start:27 stop:296 length:270 start_codon:yes stop_codon:yes gene_type:complete